MGQHGRVSEQKHPVDSAVEYVIYAPIGFALEVKRVLPTFVERGRAQVLMARTIGKFAVDQGQVQAVVAIARFQEQAQSALAAGMAAFTLASFALWVIYLQRTRVVSPP